MDWSEVFVDRFWLLYEQVLATPGSVSLALWVFGFVSAFVLLLLISVARISLVGRNIKNPQRLKIIATEEDGLVRLNRSTINKLGLSTARGQRIIVTSLRPIGSGHRRLETMIQDLSWRSDEKLKDDTIEVSEKTLAKLFKGQDMKDDDVLAFDLRLYQLTGIADYWMNPDPRTQFANRFAVYLTVFVFALQLALEQLHLG